MFVRPFDHLFHPELMQKSTIWGYGNRFGRTWSPGPTFRARYGRPIAVRIHNRLPAENPGNDGFGHSAGQHASAQLPQCIRE